MQDEQKTSALMVTILAIGVMTAGYCVFEFQRLHEMQNTLVAIITLVCLGIALIREFRLYNRVSK